MSVTEMSRRAITRRRSSLQTTRSTSADAATVASAAAASSAVSEAARTIVAYIPTEIVTLYVAAAAAIDRPSMPPGRGQWVLFWTVLALVPLLIWVSVAVQSRNAGLPLPANFKNWPLAEMVLAVVAFSLWAFSLPKSPFSNLSWYSSGLGAVVLLTGTIAVGTVASLLRVQSHRSE